MNRARLFVALCIALAAGMATPGLVHAEPSSIVICQKKKNPQKIRLRPDECKSKEDLILDLTDALTGDQSLGGRLTVIESYLGVVCEGDSSRVLAGKSDAGACERFNGNEPRCASAFASGGLGEGAVSCFFDNDGECAPCGEFQETSGFCTNACASQ